MERKRKIGERAHDVRMQQVPLLGLLQLLPRLALKEATQIGQIARVRGDTGAFSETGNNGRKSFCATPQSFLRENP